MFRCGLLNWGCPAYLRLGRKAGFPHCGFVFYYIIEIERQKQHKYTPYAYIHKCIHLQSCSSIITHLILSKKPVMSGQAIGAAVVRKTRRFKSKAFQSGALIKHMKGERHSCIIHTLKAFIKALWPHFKAGDKVSMAVRVSFIKISSHSPAKIFKIIVADM